MTEIDLITELRGFAGNTESARASLMRDAADALELTTAHLREAETARDEFHDKALDAIYGKNRAQDALREAEACIEAVEDELDRLEKACVAVPSKKFFRATIDAYKSTKTEGGER